MKVQLMGVVFDPKQILAVSPVQENKTTVENEITHSFTVYFKAGMPQKFTAKQPEDLKKAREYLIGLWDKMTTSPTGNEKTEILVI